MKIVFNPGTSQLELTSENSMDLVKLGAITARLDVTDYPVNDANGNRCVDIPLPKVLEALVGRK